MSLLDLLAQVAGNANGPSVLEECEREERVGRAGRVGGCRDSSQPGQVRAGVKATHRKCCGRAMRLVRSAKQGVDEGGFVAPRVFNAQQAGTDGDVGARLCAREGARQNYKGGYSATAQRGALDESREEWPRAVRSDRSRRAQYGQWRDEFETRHA